MQTTLCYVTEEDSLEEINTLQRKIKAEQAFSALFEILELLRVKLKYREECNSCSSQDQDNLVTELYYEKLEKVRDEIVEIIESKDIMDLL